MLNRHHREIFICLFFVLATLFIYWPIQKYEFVNYDDNLYVTENPQVQNGIGLKGVVWAFTSFHTGNWHPLTWLSHMLDWQVFGANSGRHHLTNLLFHIANTVLLFFVFKKMTGQLWQSAFVAALFALHPLHVESVAWVSERKDVLSAFFWMLTLLSYAGYVTLPSFRRYLLVVLFLALGLMSKPMLVTLPFVLFLLDYWPLYRFRFQSSKDFKISRKSFSALQLAGEKIPLLILVGISSIITFYAQRQGGAVASLFEIQLADRIENALVAYASYIGKMIYPANLSVLYLHPSLDHYPDILSWWKITGACLLLVSITFPALKTVKERPYFIVGWLWYIGTLVPVIGLIQVGNQSMADRYTYIPLIGLFIIAGWGVSDLAQQWWYQKKWFAISAAAVALLLIFMAVARNQVGYWKNSITLHAHAIEVNSDNYIAHANLGNVFNQQGRIAEAVDHYVKALAANPNSFDTHNNLGVALLKQGKADEAIPHYLKALQIKPDYAEAHFNLGVALFKQGQTEEAIKHYLRALEIKPDYGDAHFNLGLALDKQGQTQEAVNHYLKALQLNPDFAEAYVNLGVALDRQGNLGEAINNYLKALQIKPDYADAYVNLGIALDKQGRTEEAINTYLKVLHIYPDYVDARNNLGIALFRKGDINGAISCFQKVLEIRPGHENAKRNLQYLLMTRQKQKQG